MADEYEIETDEDPVFSAITPKKTNKWGVIAIGTQFIAGCFLEAGSAVEALAHMAVSRYLYEQDRATWAAEAGRELEQFQGFYLVPEDEE